MRVFAFIKSRARTEETIRDSSADVVVWDKPLAANRPDPGNDDLIVILHVSQPGDINSVLREYGCFKTCVDAICYGTAGDTEYSLHQQWMLTHRDQIRGLVLTSGANVDPTEEAAAMEKLAAHRPDVAFAFILAEDLQDYLRKGQLQDFLFSRNKEEVVLKCLSALWVFDLAWQTGGKETLPSVTPNQNELEAAVAERLKNKIGDSKTDWKLDSVKKSVKAVDEVLGKGNFASNLDGALEKLAQCETYDGGDEGWLNQYTLLRKELVGG